MASEVFDGGKWFGRVGHVEILNTQANKVYDFSGLDFKFKITRTLDSFACGFVEASVLNMNDSNRRLLTALGDLQSNVEMQRRLRIYAGYYKPGTSHNDTWGEMIADCELCEASPITSPPEIWMRFKGVYGYMFQFAEVSVVVKTPKMKFIDLCNAVVDKVFNVYDTNYRTNLAPMLSRELAERIVTDEDGVGLSYKGSLYGLLPFLSKIGDVCCFFDVGRNLNPGSSTKGSRALVVKDRPSIRNASRINDRDVYTKLVDEEHGMIGLPQFQPPCTVSCMTLLDTKLRVYDKINLRSKIIPEINGEYRIKNLTHEGHLRGREWYSRIVAYKTSWDRPISPKPTYRGGPQEVVI